jgi:hypothetical protein
MILVTAYNKEGSSFPILTGVSMFKAQKLCEEVALAQDSKPEVCGFDIYMFTPQGTVLRTYSADTLEIVASSKDPTLGRPWFEDTDNGVRKEMEELCLKNLNLSKNPLSLQTKTSK